MVQICVKHDGLIPFDKSLPPPCISSKNTHHTHTQSTFYAYGPMPLHGSIFVGWGEGEGFCTLSMKLLSLELPVLTLSDLMVAADSSPLIPHPSFWNESHIFFTSASVTAHNKNNTNQSSKKKITIYVQMTSKLIFKTWSHFVHFRIITTKVMKVQNKFLSRSCHCKSHRIIKKKTVALHTYVDGVTYS